MLIRVVVTLLVFFSTNVLAEYASEAEFMRALRHHLKDTQLLLKFADWLEIDGQKARADFIRTINSKGNKDERHDKLVRLLDKHQEEIAPGLPEHYYRKNWVNSPIDFFRGKGLPIIELSPKRVEDLGDLLGKDKSPVIGLKLDERWFNHKAFRELFKRKELKRVALLHIYSTAFLYLDEFLEAKHLTNLRELKFLEPSGVLNPAGCGKLARGIATNEKFGGLTRLKFPIWAADEKLKKLYMTSETLRWVRKSPLIHPPSVGISIDPIRPAAPYISQVEWENRFGTPATCEARTAQGG